MDLGKRLESIRTYGPSLVLLVGLAFFAHFVNGFYRIDHWLFWRYAGYWLIVSAWMLCCWSFGYEVVARLCGWLRKTEQLMVGLATGILCFGLAIFFIGLFHLLDAVTSILLPLAFFAFGARRLFRDLRRLLRKRRVRLRMPVDLRLLPFWIFSLLGIGVLYVGVMHPDAYSFDVRWYHMPIAQRYALSGYVGRFDEGQWMAAFPHLLSYVYTWIFLLPGAILFDRMALGGHVEFAIFLATLAQFPVVIRRVAPGFKAPLAWAAILAFPKIYLYDSNLNAGADHVAGFWVLPVILLGIRAWKSFEPARVCWAGVFIAAIALTKYTSFAVALPAGMILMLRGLWLTVARRSLRPLASTGALVATVLVVTAPHWLKNWVWYGDPIYPHLRAFLPARPWVEGSDDRRAVLDQIRQGAELTPAGMLEALRSTFTFSFIPNDWDFLQRDWPIFGSLFTLTLPCLVFLRRAGALWGIYLGSMASIFFWYLLAHYDRYLQAILPAMALGTAACLARVWALGLVARLSVISLVGFQIIWGSDVPFIRTHNQIGDSPIRYVAQFIASGFEQRRGRLHLFEPLRTIGKAVPEDAVLLSHETATILGTDRRWVSDQQQSLIRYGKLGSPKAIHEQLSALGVTHISWHTNSKMKESLADDLAFFAYAVLHTEDQKDVAGFYVARLPKQSPSASGDADPEVAIYSCGGPYKTGWYRLSNLTQRAPRKKRPRAKLNPDEPPSRASFVALDRRCHPNVALDPALRHVAMRGQTELYAR